MPAAFINLDIEQGSAYERTFVYLDSAGNPVDLSNYCVLLQWRTNNNISYTFSNRYDGEDYSFKANSNGTIILLIPSKTTNTYLFDGAVYDLDIQEPNEQYPGSGLKTYRLCTGNVTILKRNIEPALSDCATLSSGFNLANSCDAECGKLDVYSIIYQGSGLNIIDNSSVSGVVTTSDYRVIENVEVAINGLRHNSPQDLSFILSPPSGNKILLSSNSKILNYRPGFSFMFSNRSLPSVSLNNVTSGGLCSIVDKTSTFKLGNEILTSNISELVGNIVNGNWSLIVNDNDPGVSGTIDSWKLILTYQD